MEIDDTDPLKKGDDSDVPIDDVEKLIEQREKLDTLFQEKFSKTITVMFTDMKGSTAIADTQGDFASRTMIKQHNDIVFPIIKKNNGVLVKTMGDGTMSYFMNAQDAARTAVGIQSNIDEHNIVKKTKTPLLVRIGLHTGTGIVEKNDIFGDVVNVASRFESIGNPGEINISEETYNSITDKTEIYCRFHKTTKLKGKKEAFKVYKVFWNKEEIEADKSEPSVTVRETEIQKQKGIPLIVKLILVFSVLIIGFLVIKKAGFLQSTSDKRSIHHSVTILSDKDNQETTNGK